ncbi:MAG: o-succinylbenzoate--CoA ligase [Bacteroidota bacterium]
MIDISNTKHWLIEQAEKFNSSPAVLINNSTINYSELCESVSNLALHFVSKGIIENDNIAVLCGNNIEFVKTVNALWLIGAVPVPINTRNNFDEIGFQLKHANIKFLLIEKSLAEKFSQISFEKKIIINRVEQSTDKFHSSTQNSKLETRNSFHSTFYTRHSALILFTSGSSGKPKAVVHTFSSLYESVLLTDDLCKLNTKDVWLASLPLYHIGGFMIFVRALLSGAALAFPGSLNYENISTALQKYNPTYVSIVSTTLKQFLDNRINPNENLKHLFLGGGPLDEELCSSAIAKGFPIVKVYGSTETCSMISALYTEDFENKPNSAGKPLGKTKIKILDKNNRELTGRVGEIIVQSKSLFKGYYNDDEETKKKFVNGFYCTGDLGSIDNEGFLFVQSRKTEIIISGGENISTKEVEDAIKSCESVIDAFVFGIEDETWGEAVYAVAASNKNINERIILEHLRNKIASYKIPKKIFLLEKIPHTDLGKVKKEELLKLLNLNVH